MAAPTEATLNFGLRYANIYELDANGYPKATSATPYEGLQIKGSTAFDMTFPDARKITGLGEDGITQVVFLPPLEGGTGTLTVEAANPAVSALLDGTKVETLGDLTIVGLGTDRQGFEPQIGAMLYQSARGISTGKTYWHTYFAPSAQIVRKPGGMNADKSINTYQFAPNRSDHHLWGTDYSTGTNGFTSDQITEVWSNNPLKLTTFLGDGIEDEFSFPVAYPSLNDTPLVFVNGVKQTVTTHYTATTLKVTFAVGFIPAAGAQICVLREYAGG